MLSTDPHPAPFRPPLAWLGVLVAFLMLTLVAPSAPATAADTDPAMAADVARALRAERDRLQQENATLAERLQALEGQLAVAQRLEAQTARLTALIERLEARLAELDPAATGLASVGAATATHTQALEQQLATSEHARQDAAAQVKTLEARVAELEARLQQQQLTVEEALLRADKAEKLHAALEEAHERVRTENERLSLELTTAKARQSEAMRRVLELDARLEALGARAAGAAPRPAPAAQSAADGHPERIRVGAAEAGAGATADGVMPAVYEVRAEDTLSRIADKVYGDASAWRRIFEANRDVLDGPDDLRLGLRLIIP